MQDWWLAYWYVLKTKTLKRRKYAAHELSVFLTAVCFSMIYVCVYLWLIRADEQGKLTANSTIIQNGSNITIIQNGSNITSERNTDFYLGVYGGKLQTCSACLLHCAYFVLFQWCKRGLCFSRFDCGHHHFWLYQEFGPVQRAGEVFTVSAQPHVHRNTPNTCALL